jgi:ABC-type lipoprotein export system ATPase subunit
MGRTAIRTEGIAKDFYDGRQVRTVLADIDLQIETGEFTIIAGPSGSGKTTLLTILGLILSPTRGRIVIDGKPVKDYSDDELASLRRKYYGFVFQHADLVPALNVAENILVASYIQGGAVTRRARDRVQSILGDFGLSASAEAMPQQLSTGQRQRVAIARALFNEPILILCDEPTSALDIDSSRIVLDTLKKLSRDENRGVVMVTHDPRVFPYADRMIKLENGVITYDSNRPNQGGENDVEKN